jgi:hypothetical protein
MVFNNRHDMQELLSSKSTWKSSQRSDRITPIMDKFQAWKSGSAQKTTSGFAHEGGRRMDHSSQGGQALAGQAYAQAHAKGAGSSSNSRSSLTDSTSTGSSTKDDAYEVIPGLPASGRDYAVPRTKYKRTECGSLFRENFEDASRATVRPQL